MKNDVRDVHSKQGMDVAGWKSPARCCRRCPPAEEQLLGHVLYLYSQRAPDKETNVPLPLRCLDFANAALASLILLFRVNAPHPKELLQLSLVQSSSKHNQRLILFHPQTPRQPQHIRGQKGRQELVRVLQKPQKDGWRAALQ